MRTEITLIQKYSLKHAWMSKFLNFDSDYDATKLMHAIPQNSLLTHVESVYFDMKNVSRKVVFNFSLKLNFA